MEKTRQRCACPKGVDGSPCRGVGGRSRFLASEAKRKRNGPRTCISPSDGWRATLAPAQPCGRTPTNSLSDKSHWRFEEDEGLALRGAQTKQEERSPPRHPVHLTLTPRCSQADGHAPGTPHALQHPRRVQLPWRDLHTTVPCLPLAGRTAGCDRAELHTPAPTPAADTSRPADLWEASAARGLLPLTVPELQVTRRGNCEHMAP